MKFRENEITQMIRVKMIGATSIPELEEVINHWLAKTAVSVMDIKYQSCNSVCHWHTVLILYAAGNSYPSLKHETMNEVTRFPQQ
jgi:hypothetical protein